jgi:hypothetical protein
MNSGMSSGMNSISKFKDIKRVRNDGDEDDEVDTDDEDAVLEEDDRTNEFEEAAKRRSATRRQHEVEGFRGSVEIKSRQMRNILLALLLSCIGYLVVYSMGTNLLQLDDISPQLRKFKKLIYAGLFFGIAYICLEVF